MAFKFTALAGIALVFATRASAQKNEAFLKTVLQNARQKQLGTLTYVKDVTWTEYNKHEQYQRHCAHQFPGKFRQDIDMTDGRAELQLGTRLYRFSKFKSVGVFQAESPFDHYLLFDCYQDNYERLLERFKAEGVAVQVGYAGHWKGKKVQVIGVAAPDSTVTQVWFDAAGHYPVRYISAPSDSRNRYDFQFSLRQLDGYWLPAETRQFLNRRLIYLTVYHQLKINIALEAGVFDPDQFAQYSWYAD